MVNGLIYWIEEHKRISRKDGFKGRNEARKGAEVD